MLEEFVNEWFSSGWVYNHDPVEEIDDTPALEHSSGIEIEITETRERDPATYLLSAVTTIVCDGVETDVVVITESFDDESALREYLIEIDSAVNNGQLDFQPIAIVPHSGSTTSANLSAVREGNTEAIMESDLADVFCVDRGSLPSDIDVGDITEHRVELIETIYGLNDATAADALELVDVDESDLVDLDIDIYTVTDEELRNQSVAG